MKYQKIATEYLQTEPKEMANLVNQILVIETFCSVTVHLTQTLSATLVHDSPTGGRSHEN